MRRYAKIVKEKYSKAVYIMENHCADDCGTGNHVYLLSACAGQRWDTLFVFNPGRTVCCVLSGGFAPKFYLDRIGLLAIMILYFMESPIINQDDRFFIIRTGKKPWIITEMIGILCSSVIWILLINIMGCISSYNHMDWADYHIYTSNMKCMLIYLLAYTCIGLLILLFHLLNIKALGTAVMVTLFLLENFILDVLPNNISVFSDSADSGKILSVIKKFTFMNRMENGYMGDSFLTSILYFGIIIVVLVQLNLTYAGKHEIG